MEQWLDIPNWEGWYVVSDTGQVRSITRIVRFKDGRVRLYRSVMLEQYQDGSGYHKVTLKRNGKSWRVHVHVLVALAFIGPRPEGAHVCHSDGNCTNNYAANLRYDTPAGNIADMYRHGTAPVNESHYMCKLTTAEVGAIRRLRGVHTCKELADMFGSSPANVCNIQNNKRRKHART